MVYLPTLLSSLQNIPILEKYGKFFREKPVRRLVFLLLSYLFIRKKAGKLACLYSMKIKIRLGDAETGSTEIHQIKPTMAEFDLRRVLVVHQ